MLRRNFYCEGDEALALGAQGSCGCHSHGAQGQAGWDSEQPGQEEVSLPMAGGVEWDYI